MVIDVDAYGVTVKDSDGTVRRIESACKVWSAGVQASPLGKQLAEQSDGTEVDRAGRVIVEPDLTIKGYPNVFVVGDLMSVPNVPGQAQGAIQGSIYAAKQISASLKGQAPQERKPFKYFNKGSMATVSRFSAVCQVGKLEFGGFIAWLAWLGLHLYYLVGYRSRITTVIQWFVTFLGRSRGQMAATEQWVLRGSRWRPSARGTRPTMTNSMPRSVPGRSPRTAKPLIRRTATSKRADTLPDPSTNPMALPGPNVE